MSRMKANGLGQVILNAKSFGNGIVSQKGQTIILTWAPSFVFSLDIISFYKYNNAHLLSVWFSFYLYRDR